MCSLVCQLWVHHQFNNIGYALNEGKLIEIFNSVKITSDTQIEQFHEIPFSLRYKDENPVLFEEYICYTCDVWIFRMSS